eukprot:EG_transcript_4410
MPPPCSPPSSPPKSLHGPRSPPRLGERQVSTNSIWREATVDQLQLLDGMGVDGPSQDATQRIFSQDNTQEFQPDAESAPQLEAWGKLISTLAPSTAYLLGGDPSRRFSIGRMPTCDVVLKHAEVSQVHCLIYRTVVDGVQRAVLCDQSRNGTWLNSTRMAKGKEFVLSNGDELAFHRPRLKRSRVAMEDGVGADLDDRYIFRDLVFLRHQQHRLMSTGRYPSQSTEDVIFFQKGQVIGRGGCGIVYLGLNVADGSLMAVKQVPLGGADRDVESLEREVQLLRELRHPHIVRYLGTARSPTTLTVLLEYVPGGSLASLLSKFGPFHETVMRTYLQQILKGLEYLHGRQVVHGDIKPANILVSVNEGVKVTDFGTSFKASQRNEGGLPLMGTANYMAPEVIQTCRSSAAADIWSLGCTIIEMATARVPWSEQQYTSPYAALFNIAQITAPPEIPKSISPSATEMTAACLRLDPSQRPSCRELLASAFITTVPSPQRRSTEAVVEVAGRLVSPPLPSFDSSTDSQLTLHTDFLRDHSMGPQTFGSRSTDERNSGTTDTGDLGSSGIVSNTGMTGLVDHMGLRGSSIDLGR